MDTRFGRAQAGRKTAWRHGPTPPLEDHLAVACSALTESRLRKVHPRVAVMGAALDPSVLVAASVIRRVSIGAYLHRSCLLYQGAQLADRKSLSRIIK
jgi:hypothetical protein